ncbi:ceramidase domain-containing protein [soil metagenome]
MDWFAPMDAYCERLGPGLFAEPLNAISNLAFFAAALWGARAARATRSDAAVWMLVALVFLIGAGSTAFHMFANRLSVLADVIPISLFIYAYLGFAMRRYLGAGWIVMGGALVLLLAVTLAIEHWSPPGFLNGSGAYLPALLAGLVVAIVALAQNLAVAPYLIAASTVLAVSLIFRTADQIACSLIPIGTHFIWHLLNGLLLAVYLEAAIRFGVRRETRP